MRHLISPAFLSALVVTTLAVGCGSSAGTSSAGVDALTACKNSNAGFRGAFERCFPTSSTLSIVAEDATSTEFSARACANTLSAAGVKATPAGLSSCGDVLKSASCDAYAEALASSSFSSIPACDFAAGTLVAGAPCGADSQCAGYCERPSGKNCGVCATLPGEGAACLRSKCSKGLVCDKKTCIKPLPRIAEGGVCDSTAAAGPNCKFGLACSADKKCAILPKLGASCIDECDGARCDSTGTKTCVPFLKLGESCAYIGCEAGLRCAGPQGAQKCTSDTGAKPGEVCDNEIRCELGNCGADKKCVAIAGENESCSIGGTGALCRRGLECFDSKCQVPNATLCK
jgi:hypothetical protein